MCPGTMLLNELAIPMKGLSMSSSVSPQALSRLRLGALASPFFTVSLRMISPTT